jgi:hypothetical protein
VGEAPDAVAEYVAEALRRRKPEQRPLFLRQLIAYAAASLSLTEGEAAASETLYRAADAVVERGRP